MAKPEIQIWTDGACSGNPGPGGWGALLVAGRKRKELHGGDPDTTNNRMELMAAIEAGAEDVESGEDGHVIWCADTDLNDVSNALEAELGESESTKLVWRPTTTTEMDLDAMEKLMKLIDALEDDDDVQRVTTNFEASDEVMEQLGG